MTAIIFHMATKPTSKAEGKCICKLESWHCDGALSTPPPINQGALSLASISMPERGRSWSIAISAGFPSECCTRRSEPRLGPAELYEAGWPPDQ